MPFGVTAEGFVTKTLEQILVDIQDDEKTLISPTLNISSASVVGQYKWRNHD